MIEHASLQEEAAYVRQVQAYRRRYKYTMVHDRRDLRARRGYVHPCPTPTDKRLGEPVPGQPEPSETGQSEAPARAVGLP